MDSAAAPPDLPPPDDSAYESFVRLLVAHEPRLRAFLRGLLPSWPDVDEVMQSASLVAWRKFSSFERGTSFGGWLLTIARFEALKHRRGLARSPLVFSDEIWDLLAQEARDETGPEEDRRKALEQCLAKLEPAQRTLILEAHTPGVRLNEFARKNGRSEQALYKTIQRLRAALLDCVERTLKREEPA